ncbi:MAG: hypothetical protein RLZZ30_933 [Bacteroidota bacterium]|jgi:outer membrane protein OmpA-like peptidoglycan-associated protein/tetratricopeptide (TPR) repeat protein
MKTILIIILLGAQPILAQVSNLTKANDLFNKLGYAAAIPYFEKLEGTEFQSIETDEKLAYCYLFTESFSKSESLYKSIVTKSKNASNYYYLAYTLMREGKTKEAIDNFQIFSELNPSDSKAKLFLSNPSYLDNLMSQKPYFNLNISNINTKYDDFGVYPYPRGNGAIIVSGRNKSGFGGKVWAGDDQNFLELYYSQTGDSGNLTNPIRLAQPINSSLHDGPLCFSSNGNIVYFTSNNRSKEKTGTDGIQNLKIYIADVIESEWKNMREFQYNSTNYSCGHPSLSPDGKFIYFSSDMPGGIGGADIYRCSIEVNGKFGAPENLGMNVNTSGQEVFPWIGNDNKLYFASDGRPGLGGLDIFVSPFNGSIAAKNLGQPVNSMADDFAITFLPEGKFGYMASNRNGSDDIYSIEIITPIQFLIPIKGKTMDAQSNKLLENSLIELKDASGKVIATTRSDANGEYQFEVTPKANYSLVVANDKYKQTSQTVQVTENATQIQKDFMLSRLPNFGIDILICDKISKKAIEGVKVKIKDSAKNTVLIDDTTPVSGELEAAMKNCKIGETFTLLIELNAEGYLAKKLTFTGKFESESILKLHEQLDVSMQAINIGGDLAKTLGIKPIYFDLGKFNIRKDASVELDKIVKVMNENPTMVIELGSHTDCRGTIISNETLSQNRATSSANYIKKRITNPERIYGKGYGETKLLNDCECEGTKKSTCSEAEHQLNRRTEFIIIKM